MPIARRNLAALLSVLTLFFTGAQAQDNVITLYAIGPEASAGAGDAGGVAGVIEAIGRGGTILNVSPIAVDPNGATYYAGVGAQSVVATAIGTRLSAIALPTPTTVTFTFRADASHYYQAQKTQSAVNGVKAEVEISQECSHNVNSPDTPLEDAIIVCTGKLAINAEAQGQKLQTTFLETATGKPIPFATVTNPENLTLPTQGASGAEMGRLGGYGTGLAIAGAVAAVQLLL